MKHILFLLIKFYKFFVDPLFLSSCRFCPTCSEYFMCVVNRYTFLISLFFIFKRLLMCNVLFKGGYDPAP